MEWLEVERRAAVSIHLDELASNMWNPAPINRPNPLKETTDQGLLSNANFAQGTGTQCQGLVSQDQGSGGQMLGIVNQLQTTESQVGRGRTDVTTQQQALEVTEKREKNLEARKLDMCPLCKKSHYYEKIWDKITPPFKTKLMSTHLFSCPKFLLMTGEEQLRVVTAQSACLYCAAWDHT